MTPYIRRRVRGSDDMRRKGKGMFRKASTGPLEFHSRRLAATRLGGSFRRGALHLHPRHRTSYTFPLLPRMMEHLGSQCGLFLQVPYCTDRTDNNEVCPKSGASAVLLRSYSPTLQAKSPAKFPGKSPLVLDICNTPFRHFRPPSPTPLFLADRQHQKANS